jgi:hypothetical protein
MGQRLMSIPFHLLFSIWTLTAIYRNVVTKSQANCNGVAEGSIVENGHGSETTPVLRVEPFPWGCHVCSLTNIQVLSAWTSCPQCGPVITFDMSNAGPPPVIPNNLQQYKSVSSLSVLHISRSSDIFSSYVVDPRYQIKFTITWTSVFAFAIIASLPQAV